jgi:hypothetical protein
VPKKVITVITVTIRNIEIKSEEYSIEVLAAFIIRTHHPDDGSGKNF